MFGKKNTSTLHKKKPSGQFYFVAHNPGNSESVRDADDNVDVIELKGSGSTEEEFRPKPVNRNLVKGMSLMKQSQSDRSAVKATTTLQPNPLSRTLFALFGGNKQANTFNEEGAKKVDPKLFFANERTFLKWMNVSIWVAGISIGISSIGGTLSGGLQSLASLFFLAIAIVIVCYSMFQYGKRSLMVVKRSPGPYEDRWGPIVIGSLFVLSFTAQYCILMASLSADS